MATEDLKSLLTNIADRLSNIEAHLGLASGSASGSSATEELPRSIKGFDSYFNSTVVPFVEVCTKLGGDAVGLGNAVKDAWTEQRSFLLMASKCKVRPILQVAWYTYLIACIIGTSTSSFVSKASWRLC